MILPVSYQTTSLDEIIPPLNYGLIYAFACAEAHREQTVQVLQQGYTKLLQLRPYLGGDILVVPTEPQGVHDGRIAVADLSMPSSGWTHNYAELLEAGMPLSWLDAVLLAPYVAGTATTTKPFMVQVNWIPGGCLLTMSISHAVVDASGAGMVIQSWAQLCREIQGLSEPETHGAASEDINGANNSIPAFNNKTASGASFQTLKTRPELWKLLGLHWEDNIAPPPDAPSLPTSFPAAGGSIPGMQTAIFSFSRDAIARLKQDATPSDKSQWISGNDALTALIWRSVMRARFSHGSNFKSSTSTESQATVFNGGVESGNEPKSIVSVAINGRSLLKPPLPASYINNVVYCCMTELPLVQMLSSPLSTLASSIRRRIEAIKSDPALIHDATLLASAIPDVGKLTFAFRAFLGRDLVTSSWIDIPFYEVDFGPVLGKPDLIRVPRGQFGGLCCLQPRKPGGDVEVFVSVRGSELGELLEDEEFGRYASFVCV
ncbi:transferase family-domain-containing protein [Podospora appendiculata]|uniref:Transferase family-domain-containing protein n=1 Tax=Podospora appendiculata TaxID=314037 RepID=A0AAE0X8Q1_9PEZI|nr:transferase family-domain-containing protein [Podospora appendiculata]